MNGCATKPAVRDSCCRCAAVRLRGSYDGLAKPRLERAIGVIYRPETELASHYFQAVLPVQFDEYIWFDETRAVTPFDDEEAGRASRHLSLRLVRAAMPAREGSNMSSTSCAGCARRHIWPNGRRYLWTDAFGVVLLVSLYIALAKRRISWMRRSGWWRKSIACWGEPRGIRIGEGPDRDGQYFHYLAMWLYALAVIGRHVPDTARKASISSIEIHDAFLVPGRGVIWKMKEDLSGPYPGYGLGALDAFDGYVSYRCSTRKRCPARSPTCGA